ncbi:MAG: DUF2236 domain-containing protein, partial [Ferruginibacter sp.]
DLYTQYRKHLGGFRYIILKESQKLVVPVEVKILLGFKRVSFLKFFVPVYKFSRKIKLDGMIKFFLLPGKYKQEIQALDR